MSEGLSQCVHGTCIDIGGIGLLLLGAPGTGKSDLALRLIDAEGYGLGQKVLRASLVSDDQTVLQKRGNRLLASAPSVIAGRLEVRGIGILHLDHVRETELAAVVRLVSPHAVERLPGDFRYETYCGIDVPLFDVAAFEISAASKLRALASDILVYRNPQAVHGLHAERT